MIRLGSWTTLLVLAACAVLIGLGIWQLARMEQRRAFNALVRERIDAPPITDLAEIDSRLSAGQSPDQFSYRALIVRGEFDHSQEVALKNQVWQGRRGAHLITPLRIAGSERAVLVDRGWIPEAQDAADKRSEFAEPGLVEVRGWIRLSQPARFATTALDVPQDAWYRVDVTGLQNQIAEPLLPFYIQAAPDSVTEGSRLPIRAPLDLELSDGKHLGYALTWFVLALGLGVGYVQLIRKQSPRAARVILPTSQSNQANRREA